MIIPKEVKVGQTNLQSENIKCVCVCVCVCVFIEYKYILGVEEIFSIVFLPYAIFLLIYL